MSPVKRLAMMCAAILVTAGIGGSAAPVPQIVSEAPSETVARTRKALERLPYYGVFDFLAFAVNNKIITLQGYAHRPSLKSEAEDMVRKATKAEIANKIEVLPTSPFDDRIRWEAYQRIYTEEFASRYVSGGPMRVRYELLDMLRFPGMQPYGNYPVHIVVKDRKLILIGVVDNDFDKRSLLVRARAVANTTGVDDAVMVRTSGTT
jgi:hyperosmotically inducible protein